MATGPEHYKEAERLLAYCRDVSNNSNLTPAEKVDVENLSVAVAQVHASLALAAAHAMGIGDLPSPDWDAWREVAQTRDEKGRIVD